MSFTATGSYLATTSGPSITTSGVGNLFLLSIGNAANATVVATAVTSTNATWTLVGNHPSTNGTPATVSLFIGKTTAASTATASITWSSTTPGSVTHFGHEFTSTVGSWSVARFQVFDNASPDTHMVALAVSAGDIYFGALGDQATATNGSTAGFTYATVTNGNASVFGIAAGGGTSDPGMGGDTDITSGMAMVVTESVPSPASSFGNAVPAQAIPGFIPGTTPVIQTPLALVTIFPAATVSTAVNANITATVLEATISLSAPTVIVKALPGTLGQSVNFPALAVTETARPASVALAASISSPTGEVIVLPASLASSSGLAVSTEKITALPSSLACVAAFPAPALSAGSVVSAVSLATAVTFPAPAVKVTVLGSPLAGAASLPASTEKVTALPASLTAAASFPASIPAVTVLASALALTTTLPAPAVKVAPTPSSLAALTTLPSPVVAVTVLPAVLGVNATLPAPAVKVIALPGSLAGQAVFTAPAISSGSPANVFPSVLGCAVSLPSALIALTATPDALALQVIFPFAAPEVPFGPFCFSETAVDSNHFGGSGPDPFAGLGGTETDHNAGLGGIEADKNPYFGAGTSGYGGSSAETNKYGGISADPHSGYGGTGSDANHYGGTAGPDNFGGSVNAGGFVNMQAVNITLGEFNDETINLAITNNSVAFDLTTIVNYGLQVLLKTAAGVEDTDPTTVVLSTASGSTIAGAINSAITITNAAGGLATLVIPNSQLDTTSFTFWRCDVTGGNGASQATAMYGSVTMKAL